LTIWAVAISVGAVDVFFVVKAIAGGETPNHFGMILTIVLIVHTSSLITLAAPFFLIPILKYLTLLGLAILLSPCLICYLGHQELDQGRDQTYREDDSESLDSSMENV
jgi:hypothetical protein